mmetsp:Transcript_41627/g.114793  ORF Transcript_41627/g.114793 Transcript_41627/m.114793 type:complete len:237 (-) Transcript_41627:1491-2201(-)
MRGLPGAGEPAPASHADLVVAILVRIRTWVTQQLVGVPFDETRRCVVVPRARLLVRFVEIAQRFHLSPDAPRLDLSLKPFQEGLLLGLEFLLYLPPCRDAVASVFVKAFPRFFLTLAPHWNRLKLDLREGFCHRLLAAIVLQLLQKEGDLLLQNGILLLSCLEFFHRLLIFEIPHLRVPQLFLPPHICRVLVPHVLLVLFQPCFELFDLLLERCDLGLLFVELKLELPLFLPHDVV